MFDYVLNISSKTVYDDLHLSDFGQCQVNVRIVDMHLCWIKASAAH